MPLLCWVTESVPGHRSAAGLVFLLVHLCVKSALTVDDHLFEQKISPIFCVHIRSSYAQGNKGRRMGCD